MSPAALVAGASLPMFLSGILHMPSLAVLIMLFVSNPRTSYTILNIYSLWPMELNLLFYFYAVQILGIKNGYLG